MANTLTGLIPILYEAMDIIAREMVGFIPAVYRNSNAERAALNQTVRYPVVPAATTGDIVPGQLPPDDGDQTIGYSDMVISKSKYSPIRWAGEEQRSVDAGGQRRTIVVNQYAQSLRALVNLMEADLAVAATTASRAYGTAGNAPFGTAGDLSDLANARKILEDNGAPMQDLHFVGNSAAWVNLRGKMSNLFRVNEAGTDDLLRLGQLAQLLGIGMHESAAIVPTTKGTGTAYVTGGSPTPVGSTSIALVTGSGTVVPGDVVTFAADANNKYVVTTGIAAPGTITIANPGLKVQIPAGNAMTIGANYSGNAVFHRNALHLVTRHPVMPEEGDAADDVLDLTDSLTGLSFQVAVYRLYRRVKYEIGIAWGTKAVKPEFMVTLMG